MIDWYEKKKTHEKNANVANRNETKWYGTIHMHIQYAYNLEWENSHKHFYAWNDQLSIKTKGGSKHEWIEMQMCALNEQLIVLYNRKQQKKINKRKITIQKQMLESRNTFEIYWANRYGN